MSVKTYNGSCHCGAVRFQADIDLSQGTGRCNCSICSKQRMWSTMIKPDAFRLLDGADALIKYQFNTKSSDWPFCRTCGVRAFNTGHVAEIGGAFLSINLACLDDVSPQELIDAPIRYFDGRHNNWMETPAEVRHL